MVSDVPTPGPFHSPRALSRRDIVKAGVLGSIVLATGGVLSGCGDESGAGTDPAASGPQLVPLFNPNRVIAAGIPQRLPFGLVDNGITLTGDGEAIAARVLLDGETIDETEVIGRVVAHDHPDGTEEHQHSGLLRYYALRTTLPRPGVFDIELDIGGVTATAPVQAFDPSEIGVLLPGEPFPAIATPTIIDPSGVDALCTQPNEPCPFHDHSADDLLAERKPMAVLVATPAFCATAYCGPVLDTMIEAAPAAPGIAVVHLEPYANARAVSGDLTSPDLLLAASLEPLGLDYEPVLFLVGSDGVIVDRIDNVFDLSEVEPLLASLA